MKMKKKVGGFILSDLKMNYKVIHSRHGVLATGWKYRSSEERIKICPHLFRDNYLKQKIRLAMEETYYFQHKE